jgi:hypothetical protein
MRLWELLVNLFTIICFAAMLLKSWLTKSWSGDWIELAFGFGGMVICLFPEEATQYQVWRGWTNQQRVRMQPAWFLKLVGILLLIAGAYSIFTGSEWLDEILKR